MKGKVLAVLLLTASPVFLTAGAQDDFRWQTDLEAATRLAADSGKPLLIVFR